jgi:hypothetical protein
MLRKALEAQGAAIADNPHYEVRAQEQSPVAAVTPLREAASASATGRLSEHANVQEGEDSGGIYL